MKKLFIYYVIHTVINIALLISLQGHIELSGASLLPAFLMLLMLFQVSLFKTSAKDNEASDTAYSVGNTVRLTEAEQASQYSYFRHSFLFCIPFELPLVFFLSPYWKLLGLIPYFLAYAIGGTVFKLKKGSEIKDRINREKKELEEQIKREEMGLK